jgi:hypothetical protein
MADALEDLLAEMHAFKAELGMLQEIDVSDESRADGSLIADKCRAFRRRAQALHFSDVPILAPDATLTAGKGEAFMVKLLAYWNRCPLDDVMALSAIVFDVDGTLIDSNAAHAQAWDTALKKHGYRVSTDRIAVEIGRGGDKLVPSILGKQIEHTDGASLRKAHTVEFTKIAESTRLALFPGVDLLLTALRKAV